jgi:diguanylate cyclase (GGDEF)-like protein
MPMSSSTKSGNYALIDGRTFERYSAPAISSSGESFGRIWTFSDISSRKEYEQQLTYQAYHDAVTGLPNRISLTNHLLAALRKTEWSGKQLAILFLDLDRFKVVNDSLGHQKGDQLLVQVAKRLRASLRPGDIAARFGGDEFVVLLEDVQDMDDATKVADRIATYMKEPFLLDSHEVTVTASIGIMLGSGLTDVPDDLLRKADVAMYRAKNSGKAQYQVFSEISSGPVMERLQLEIDLQSAIKRQQFEVCYQPIINIANGEIDTWEALLRWHHPVRGLVPPAQFIPLAEETGLIVEIGAYVLRVACEQAKKWSYGRNAQHMHINLSAKQFEQIGLVTQIERVLRETELLPAQLMLEITETTMMSNAVTAIKQLEDLKKLGVGIAIDDFGTGYSSLSYLEDFPIDMIKIDRSFIWRLHERTAIVRAITAMGEALGVNITAEGIETKEQLAYLRAFPCQYGQGFWFSQPLSPLEAEKKLIWQ